MESVGCEPAPILTPPALVDPGRIMRRLLPILAICADICWLAPVPTAIMAITAPTPMIIPSMVRAERILFTHRARNDIFMVEGMLIISIQKSTEKKDVPQGSQRIAERKP
jgi:hypothetical protein